MRKLADFLFFVLVFVFTFVTKNSVFVFGTLDQFQHCIKSSSSLCIIRNVTFSKNSNLSLGEPNYDVHQLHFINSTLERLPHVFTLFTNLSEVIAANCRIESIVRKDFRNAVAIKMLDLSSNNIRHLPSKVFADAAELEDLRLSNNEIRELHGDTFENSSSLADLLLNHNKITNLPDDVFRPLVALQYLSLENNRIDLIDESTFRYNKKLKTILLNNNQLLVFDAASLFHISNWNLVDVSENNIKGIKLQSVHSLRAVRSALTMCTITGTVVRINVGDNHLQTLNLTNADAIRELNIRKNKFSSLEPFENIRSLEVLDVSKNPLATINHFAKMKHLYELRLSGVKLHSKLRLLETLTQELTVLDLSATDLPSEGLQLLSRLKKLERLYIDSNNFHHLPYTSLKKNHPQLKEVGISGNLFTCEYLSAILKYFKENEIALKVPKKFNMWRDFAGVQCDENQSSEQDRQEEHCSAWEYAKTVFGTCLTICVAVIVYRLLKNSKRFRASTNESANQAESIRAPIYARARSPNIAASEML